MISDVTAYSITLQDWQSIAPALALMGAAMLVVLVDMFRSPQAGKGPLEFLSYLGIAGALAFLLGRASGRVEGFGGTIVFDDLAMVLSLAIVAATGLVILLAPEDIRRRRIYLGEFYALLLLAGSGMILLVQTTDLVTLFLALEMLSLAVYVLTGITRRQPRAAEAAMKYFITGAFATGFLLFGMTFLYGATGSIHFSQMAARLSSGSPMTILGLALLMVGFGFKVGAVPFHMWVPDVYEGAPTSITAFMSVAVKTAGFGALIRLLLVALPSQSPLWGDLLWGLAAATMVVGNLMAVPQRSVKRMLAYSSIAHSGYIFLGLAALKSGGPEVGAAAVFYLFVYTFMTFGSFAVLIYLGREVSFPGRRSAEWQDAETLEDFSGVAHQRPWAAAAMTIFMISLAGIPPTAGFAGKFQLFRAAIDHGYYALAIIGIATSIVSVYYYLRVVVYMYMRDPLEDPTPRPDPHVAAAVAAAAILTVALGVLPSPLTELSQRALAGLFAR